MDLGIIKLSKGSQKKDRYMRSLTYEIKKKKQIQMNFFTKQKWTHRYRKQTIVTRGKKVGRNKLGIWD